MISKTSNEHGVIETTVTFESKTFENAQMAIWKIVEVLKRMRDTYSMEEILATKVEPIPTDVKLSAPTVEKVIYDPIRGIYKEEENV